MLTFVFPWLPATESQGDYTVTQRLLRLKSFHIRLRRARVAAAAVSVTAFVAAGISAMPVTAATVPTVLNGLPSPTLPTSTLPTPISTGPAAALQEIGIAHLDAVAAGAAAGDRKSTRL